MPQVNTVVLLHGLASNSTRWWHFLSTSALRGRWTLIAPDLRGHAGSSEYRRIGMREWCDEVVSLLDAQGCERAVIAGHCLGAHIALQFAARHPGRTRALVLVEPMPRGALSGWKRALAPARPALVAVASLLRFAHALGIPGRSVEPMNLEQWDRATHSGASMERYGSVLSDLRSMTLPAYLQALAAFLEPLPDLSQIRMPALVLVSTGSTLADGPRTRAAMRKLPDARIVSIPAGHWIPAEQPEAMREAIDAWLSRNAS